MTCWPEWTSYLPIPPAPACTHSSNVYTPHSPLSSDVYTPQSAISNPQSPEDDPRGAFPGAQRRLVARRRSSGSAREASRPLGFTVRSPAHLHALLSVARGMAARDRGPGDGAFFCVRSLCPFREIVGTPSPKENPG